MTMRVYVGTYAKYNSGSIEGKWLDLENYADAGEFYDACRELHKDEAYPKFMFQDHEGIPQSLIGESYIDPAVWELLDLSDDIDTDAALAYVECFGEWDKRQFYDRYRGHYDSWEDMCEEYLEDTGILAGIQEWARPYFDYEAYANDVRCSGDYEESDGYFFRNH